MLETTIFEPSYVIILNITFLFTIFRRKKKRKRTKERKRKKQQTLNWHRIKNLQRIDLIGK